MAKRTHRIAAWATIAAAWSVFTPLAATQSRPLSTARVLLHNNAGVSLATLSRAQQLVRLVYRRVGVDIEWVDGSEPSSAPSAPSALQTFTRAITLNLLSDSMEPDAQIRTGALGFTSSSSLEPPPGPSSE
jgi:hypothetical protein